MAGSPFGLAYGLGAGLAGIPNAITAGKEQALAMSMKNLQLKDMERQQREQQMTDEVLSTQLPARMQTVDVMGANPEYAAQAGAERAQTGLNQASVSEFGDEGQGQQAPEYSMAPTAPQQIKTGTKQEKYVYSTPHEQMADELTQRAEMLQKMGLGRSAFKLQQEAAQHAGLHTEMLSQKAVKMLAARSSEAVPLLNKLGIPAKGLINLDDGSMAIETGDRPEDFIVVSPEMMAALAAPDAKIGDIYTKIMHENNLLKGKEMQYEAYNQRTKIMGENYARKAGMTGEKATAFQRNAEAWAKTAGVSLKDAMERFLPKNMNNVAPNQRMNMLNTVTNNIRKNYGSGWVPDINSKDQAEKQDSITIMENVAQMRELSARGVPMPSNSPTAAPAKAGIRTGPNNTWAEGDISADGKWQAGPGQKWVPYGGK